MVVVVELLVVDGARRVHVKVPSILRQCVPGVHVSIFRAHSSISGSVKPFDIRLQSILLRKLTAARIYLCESCNHEGPF